MHNAIKSKIFAPIASYLDENNGGHIFFGSAGIYFSEKNILKPDLMVVLKKNENILNWQGGVEGVPDMVVEVLSKSTRKRDLTIKKDIYERNGVGVYWIVDPWIKGVTVYNLRDGKYELDDEYIYFDEKEFSRLEDYEKAEVKFEVPITIFGDDLTIKLAYLFK